MAGSWTNPQDHQQKLQNTIAFVEYSLRFSWCLKAIENPNQSLSSTFTKRLSIRSVM